MTTPAPFDPSVTPSVVLAGQVWPVPELGWRDLKKCRSALIELNRRLNAAIAASVAASDEADEARGARHMAAMADLFNGLSDEDCERLVMEPLLAALQAQHPGLTRAAFFGWHTSELERQLAWLTVRRQSGLFVIYAGADAAGEADGAT